MRLLSVLLLIPTLGLVDAGRRRRKQQAGDPVQGPAVRLLRGLCRLPRTTASR